jgi:hypothetical protein
MNKFTPPPLGVGGLDSISLLCSMSDLLFVLILTLFMTYIHIYLKNIRASLVNHCAFHLHGDECLNNAKEFAN